MKVRFLCFLLVILTACGSREIEPFTNAEEMHVNESDAEKTWSEYHERIKNRRMAEASAINLELESNNITDETSLILDFSFFTPDEAGAISIKKQLSENYEMSIRKDGEYWHVDGTSRPYAINLSTQQHLGWVEFMHDVALSHGCIFSFWSLTEPEKNLVWSNENIETEFD